MYSLNVENHQDFYFVQIERSEQFTQAIKPFIIGSGSGTYISVQKSKYNDFLKTVKKFYGSDVIINEELAFDSQEPISDCMITNVVTKRNINDVLISSDYHDDNARDGYNDLPKRFASACTISDQHDFVNSTTTDEIRDKKYSTVKIKNDNEILKLYFHYDPILIQCIKKLAGSKFDYQDKCWMVPAIHRLELLRLIAKRNKNIHYQ